MWKKRDSSSQLAKAPLVKHLVDVYGSPENVPTPMSRRNVDFDMEPLPPSAIESQLQHEQNTNNEKLSKTSSVFGLNDGQKNNTSMRENSGVSLHENESFQSMHSNVADSFGVKLKF